MKPKLVEEVGKVFKFEKQMFGIERFAVGQSLSGAEPS
jgi:hypothetical protein